MQVGDLNRQKMQDICANTCNTLTPVTYLLNIFGLAYNVNRGAPCRFKCTYLTAGLLTSSSIFIMYYKILYLSSELNSSVRLTDYVQNTFDLCQYIVDLFFVHKGKKFYSEFIRNYRMIDQIIGTGSCMEIRRRLINMVTLFVLMWLVTSMLDYASWVINYGWIPPSAYTIAYLYFFIKILNNLDLTSQTLHIEIRLRIIADLMHTYYNTTENQHGVTCDSLKNKNWFYDTNNLRVNERESLKKCYSKDCHEIKWLSRCYILLTEQCVFINQMFGVRILLNCLSLLIDMVRFSNLAVRILTGSQQTTQQYYYYPMISTIFRLLACMVILISLVGHCERAYRQTERIVSISDHLLLNKNAGPLMRDAVIELRGLVQDHPINFHLANFMRLDYTMLLSFASVVVTYSIILLETKST